MSRAVWKHRVLECRIERPGGGGMFTASGDRRISRVLVHLTVLIALAMSSFVSAQDEMSMYPKRWYNGMQRTAGKYVEFITVAYGMDS